MRNLRRSVPVVLFIVSVFYIKAFSHIYIPEVKPLPAGTTAPLFELKDISGKMQSPVTLKMEESITVIFFWSLFDQWSPENFYRWELVYQKYKKRGLTMFGINLDGNTSEFKKLFKKYRRTYPTAIDTGPGGGEIADGIDKIIQSMVTFDEKTGKMKEQIIGVGTTGRTQDLYKVGIIPSLMIFNKGVLQFYQGLGLNSGKFSDEEWNKMNDYLEKNLPAPMEKKGKNKK